MLRIGRKYFVTEREFNIYFNEFLENIENNRRFEDELSDFNKRYIRLSFKPLYYCISWKLYKHRNKKKSLGIVINDGDNLYLENLPNDYWNYRKYILVIIRDYLIKYCSLLNENCNDYIKVNSNGVNNKNDFDDYILEIKQYCETLDKYIKLQQTNYDLNILYGIFPFVLNKLN